MAKRKKFKRNKRFSKKSWHEPSGYNNHHRLPSSRGGTNEPSNLSRVPIRLHNAFNLLFGSNPTAHEVAKILSDIWIDYRYVIIVKPRGEENETDYPQSSTALV